MITKKFYSKKLPFFKILEMGNSPPSGAFDIRGYNFDIDSVFKFEVKIIEKLSCKNCRKIIIVMSAQYAAPTHNQINFWFFKKYDGFCEVFSVHFFHFEHTRYRPGIRDIVQL